MKTNMNEMSTLLKKLEKEYLGNLKENGRNKHKRKIIG